MAFTGGTVAPCDLLPFLTCRVGETWFAIPAVTVERVVEDAEGLPVCRIPGTEMEPVEKGAAFLVSAAGGTRAGFSIDEVGAIRTFPATSFYFLPEYLRGMCHRAFWGVGFIEGCAYFLLDLSDIDPEAVMKLPFKEETNA